jgi:hypothetical protein
MPLARPFQTSLTFSGKVRSLSERGGGRQVWSKHSSHFVFGIVDDEKKFYEIVTRWLEYQLSPGNCTTG